MSISVNNLHEFGPQLTTCAADPILDEEGNPLLDESGNNLCPETVITVPDVPIDSPNDIAGLVLWLDGSDITTLMTLKGSDPFGTGQNQVTQDGDTVAGWLDKSGQNHHMNQTGSAQELFYKTDIQNGLSILRSTVTIGDFLFAGATVLSQDQQVTIFSTISLVANETFGTLFSNAEGPDTALSQIIDARAGNRYGGNVKDSSGNNFAAMPSDIGTDFNQHTLVRDGSSLTSRLNGTAGDVETISGDGNTANDFTMIMAGRRTVQAGQEPVFGDLGELIVYDKTLSNKDIDRVETWLKVKWATP